MVIIIDTRTEQQYEGFPVIPKPSTITDSPLCTQNYPTIEHPHCTNFPMNTYFFGCNSELMFDEYLSKIRKTGAYVGQPNSPRDTCHNMVEYLSSLGLSKGHECLANATFVSGEDVSLIFELNDESCTMNEDVICRKVEQATQIASTTVSICRNQQSLKRCQDFLTIKTQLTNPTINERCQVPQMQNETMSHSFVYSALKFIFAFLTAPFHAIFSLSDPTKWFVTQKIISTIRDLLMCIHSALQYSCGSYYTTVSSKLLQLMRCAPEGVYALGFVSKVLISSAIIPILIPMFFIQRIAILQFIYNAPLIGAFVEGYDFYDIANIIGIIIGLKTYAQFLFTTIKKKTIKHQA